MALPQFTMRQLLEAGVHFGHQTFRWNPQMKKYIYGSRNGIHIIDLQQTVPMLYQALAALHAASSNGGRILFVASKKQAKDIVVETAERCGQYYVNNRWLGGTMTNWKTLSASIKRLKKLEEMLQNTEECAHFTKKELLMMERERMKLERSLGGIKNMGGLPDILFVIDTNREKLCIQEAKRLGIPVIGIVDTNTTDENITYPIPGNDDSTRSIKLYCQLASDTILDGISAQMSKIESRGERGKDIEMPSKGESNGARKTTVKLSPKASAAAEDEPSDDNAASEKTAVKAASPVASEAKKAPVKAAATTATAH